MEKTGKKMSRQNLTQRLGRDNFQEQDMRMIAEMLECPFHLSIMSAEGAGEVRSIAALERAAAARVEAVEASGHKELTAKEQAEAEYAEPEEQILPLKERAHIVTKEEIKETIEYMSRYSLYAYENELRQGFLTLEGGHRVGVAGKVIVDRGKVKNIQYISSLKYAIH